MSAISGKDTKPEILVRKHLFKKGFRYRTNVSTLPGKPDIVLRKYRTVIFVNGCFWHGHNDCKKSNLPKTNSSFWKEKILKNINRDKKNQEVLKKDGWNIIVIWQCQINNREKFEETMEAVINDTIEKY